MAETIVNFNAGTPNTTAGVEVFPDGALGDAASRTYVSNGSQGVAVAFGQNTAGAETSLSTSGSILVPTPGLSATWAWRFRITRAIGAVAFDLLAARNSTGKMSAMSILANGTMRASAGTTSAVVGTAFTPVVGVNYVGVLATQVVGAATGVTYGKVINEDTGVVVYEGKVTNAANGTTNVIKGIVGKPAATTGTIVMDDLKISNTYNEALLPEPLTVVSTATITADKTANVEPGDTVTLTLSGTGTLTQTAGKTVTINGTGNTRTFEAPYGVTSSTLTFTYGAATVNVGVLRATRFLVTVGGPTPTLVPLATGVVPPFNVAGEPTGTPIWEENFTTALDLALTAPAVTTAKWWANDAYWQGLRGYIDFASSTTWNLHPAESLGGATRSAFGIENGSLIITAAPMPSAWTTDVRASMTAQGIPTSTPVPAWTGGMLISNKNLKRFKYGYIAARIQFPVTVQAPNGLGKGSFPAWWLYSSDGDGNVQGKPGAEIDILEVIDGIPQINLHYRVKDANNQWVDARPAKNFSLAGLGLNMTQPNVFGVDWQPTYLRFYVNGVQVWEVTGLDATWFDTDMSVRLNYAMTNPDATTPSSLRMATDWVKQWTSAGA